MKILLTYVFLIITIISCTQNKIPNNKLRVDYLIKIDSLKTLVREGDVIFRGGTDIESAIIRDFSYKDKLFSHCGIILKVENKFAIIHILGGSSNPDGNILIQSINDFFTYPNNESAGIYKIDFTNEEIAKLHIYIDSVKKQKVTFDLEFNLLTKNKLYCSEFIIDAIGFAKNNNKLFPYTAFYLKNTKYSPIVNKGDSFLFYPIDVFQHNRLLKEKAIFHFPNYKK